MWNFLDRIIAYDIVIAHISGRAVAASDFLSTMQTDPTQSLELKLHKYIPMEEIDMDMKAKTPDESMLAIEPEQPEQVGPQPHVLSENIINIINSSQALQSPIPHLNGLLAYTSKDTISDVLTTGT